MDKRLEKTAKRTEPVTLAGGRTVPYERSEARLTDILEGVCKDSEHRQECNEILSKDEDLIRKWFKGVPRGSFEKEVCSVVCTCKSCSGSSKPNAQAQKQQHDSKWWHKWCPCKGNCKCSDWKKCAIGGVKKASEVGKYYGKKATETAWEYGKLANQKLDSLPIEKVTDKLPLSSGNRRFVKNNWKTIALTLLLLILTPLYYIVNPGQAPQAGQRRPQQHQQGRARQSSLSRTSARLRSSKD